MIPIRLESLLYMLVSLDVLGVSLAWRWLDHWGHLGGAAYGILYTKYGQAAWDRLRHACAQLELGHGV
jgi:rhomboid-like protein